MAFPRVASAGTFGGTANERASFRNYEDVLFSAPPEYTISATLRLVAPYDLRAMNDEFQTAKLISEKGGVGTFRITYRPFHRQTVTANPNWRQDDRSMTEYLRPRPAANWDAALRTQILAELKAEGIDPERLDDKALVERVSRWAIRRSTFNDQFGLWMVGFRDGRPFVPKTLRAPFAENEPKGKSLAWVFDRELYGKGMVENRTHGACTSSSTYLATILRAVGIPTRIVVTVPVFDANDPRQIAMVKASVKHHRTARTILAGNGQRGFSNHLFNEVWIGRKWVRLNYDALGQGILDRNYGGLMTHVLTANDVSDIPFASTWGPRYGKGEGPKLSSVNPYQLVALEERMPDGMSNPTIPALNVSTIIAILPQGDSQIPSWIKLDAGVDALLSVREWLADDYQQMRDFEEGAGRRFTLHAAGHPDVAARLSGHKYSTDGRFQAYGLRLSSHLEPGVAYTLVPDNGGHSKVWKVADGVTWTAR